MHHITLSALLIIGMLLYVSISSVESNEVTIAPSESFPIKCGPGSRNRRCAEAPTDQTVPTTSFAIETTTYNTTVCSGGSVPDGNGGCYFIEICESLFGPCDCRYKKKKDRRIVIVVLVVSINYR